MPKPKRRRATKSPVTVQASEASTRSVGYPSQLISPEEREAFELPDLGAFVARLRLDLDGNADHGRRLRLYDLALQELEAARDKGSRLYTMQTNAGELVNPEDVEAYAARLVELIAKLRIEKERLKLAQESNRPAIAAPDMGPLMKASAPSAPSFSPASSAKVYPDILTAEETAELLRLKLARFYQVYRSLGIPYFTEHRQLRFRKAQVEAWIEKQEKSTLVNPPETGAGPRRKE